MSSRVFVKRVQWACITIEVSYEPNWLGLTIGGEPVAHLQLRSLNPERAALPMSETGYISRFVSGDEIEASGGPIAYVLAWLNAEADSRAWVPSTCAANTQVPRRGSFLRIWNRLSAGHFEDSSRLRRTRAGIQSARAERHSRV
jgi:hypothetical protein